MTSPDPLISIDTLKGSYYANPVVDKPTVPLTLREAYPEYYGENICEIALVQIATKSRSLSHTGPSNDVKEVEGFEQAFKDLGRYA